MAGESSARSPGGWRYRAWQALGGARERVSDADRDAALAELPAELRRAFLRMAPRDRAHALRVLRRLADEEPVLRQAALLHDAGKAVAPLGTIGRSLVVLAEAGHATRLLEAVPVLGSRIRRYRDHPRIGAELLRQAGADARLVEIVAEHEARHPRLAETLRLQVVDGRE